MSDEHCASGESLVIGWFVLERCLGLSGTYRAYPRLGLSGTYRAYPRLGLSGTYRARPPNIKPTKNQRLKTHGPAR